MTTFVYNFETSQELTEEQLDFLNHYLMEKLPSSDEDLEDIPEWTSEIELQEVREEDY